MFVLKSIVKRTLSENMNVLCIFIFKPFFCGGMAEISKWEWQVGGPSVHLLKPHHRLVLPPIIHLLSPANQDWLFCVCVKSVYVNLCRKKNLWEGGEGLCHLQG